MKPVDLEKIKKLLPACPSVMFRDHYFNSAILLLLILDGGEYHFIFERRSSHIRQGREICFPGGMFDPEKDQDFQQTAVRETSEELAIPFDKIKILGRMDTLLTPQGVLVEGFVGTADVRFEEIKTDPREVEYVFSVPVAFFAQQEPEKYQLDIMVHPFRINENGKEEILFPAKELQVPDKYSSPWQGRKHNVYVYRYRGEVIWGITAAFIYSFIKHYYQKIAY